MAAGLFRALVKESPALGNVRVDVDSAGLAAGVGSPAAVEAVEAMRSRGVDISGHEARAVGDDTPQYDLILTMTEEHKAQILLRYPECAANVFTLKEYARAEGSKNISDPFGLGDEAYQKALDEIERAVRGAVRRLAQDWS